MQRGRVLSVTHPRGNLPGSVWEGPTEAEALFFRMLGLAGLGEARKKSACGWGSEAPAAQAERKGCCLQAAAGALGAEVAAYAAAGARHEEDAARRARDHGAAVASLRSSASGAAVALQAAGPPLR